MKPSDEEELKSELEDTIQALADIIEKPLKNKQ